MRSQPVAAEPQAQRAVPVTPYARIALAATCLGSLAAAFALFAVPALLPTISADYRLQPRSAALAMSAFCLVGLVLTVPAGWIMKAFGTRFVKHGLKAAAVLAMAALALGCALAAAASDFGTLLLARALQGAGFTAIGMVCRTTAGVWFPPHRVAVALWLTRASQAAGGLAAMLTVPWILRAHGAAGVWWTCTTLACVGLLAVATLVRMPPWLLAAAGFFAASLTAPRHNRPRNTPSAYANRRLWLLAATVCLLALPAQAILTFSVSYAHQVRGTSLQLAGALGGVVMLGWLLGSAVGGLITSWARYRFPAFAVVAAAVTALVASGFTLTSPPMLVWAFLLGFLGLGFCHEAALTAVPVVVGRPELISVGTDVCTLQRRPSRHCRATTAGNPPRPPQLDGLRLLARIAAGRRPRRDRRRWTRHRTGRRADKGGPSRRVGSPASCL